MIIWYYSKQGFGILLTILGAILLFVAISFCAILQWLVSNIVFIVAGIGTLIFLLYYLASVYSYIKDVKVIRLNFKGEEANDLILALREKTILSAKKMLILMFAYAFLWGVVVWFLKLWLL